MLCEAANLLNVVLQIYITDKFLSGQFINLGADVWREGLESSVDPLDEVFPKVTYLSVISKLNCNCNSI